MEHTRRFDKVSYVVQLNNLVGCYLLKIDIHPFCLSTTGEPEKAVRFPSMDDAARHIASLVPPESTDTFQIIEMYERLVLGTKANDLMERIKMKKAAGIEYKTQTRPYVPLKFRGKNIKKGGRM